MKIHSLVGRTLMSKFADGVSRRSKSRNFASELVSFRNILRFASMIACLYVAGAVGLCQDAATLSGIVKDPAGLVIPNAVVTLINQKTSGSLTSVTDSAGAYSFRQLPAGDYRVQTNAPGFAISEKLVSLNAGQIAKIDLCSTSGIR